jgi:hypothetical protein
MQTRSTLLMGKRPRCPRSPKHPIHLHGRYFRGANCHEQTASKRVPRYLCYPCGHTISVLPEDTLPYRPVSVSKVQESFDARVLGTPEPPQTEKERGCLKRAWARFKQRVEALLTALGQMIATVEPNASELWKQLRRFGNLEAILRLLGGKFKISLLGNYRCLKPWPPRPQSGG